jgi:hypothetical protein
MRGLVDDGIQEYFDTKILKTSIAGRSCHICNALLQRMV